MKILRTYIRVYAYDMNESLKFYENLLGERASLRFKYRETGLELAAVGNVLILAGSDQDLEPYRQTKATFQVDAIHEFYDYLLKFGCKVVRGLTQVPTGSNFTVRHPDDTVFEYVEHHA